MTVCTPEAAKRCGKNFGEKIVGQYMRRFDWFVVATSLEQLGRIIAVHEGFVDAQGRADQTVSSQITNALRVRLRRGEIKEAWSDEGRGYRKVLSCEREQTQERQRRNERSKRRSRRLYDSIRYAY